MELQKTDAAAPAVIRREDYRPPLWLVPEISLDFDLDPRTTRVTARLTVTRNGSHDRPLRLDGDGLAPLLVKVDGEALSARDWRLDGGVLVIALDGESHVVETVVEISPEANTKLMGSMPRAACSAPSASRRASVASPSSPTGRTCCPATK